MRLFLFFLGLNLVFGMDTENITNFRKTEGWLETDHFGSGYHLVPDYIKPNIWIKAFKYDGAVGDVAGLPNNMLVGRNSGFKEAISADSFPKGGGFNELMNRIPWDTPMANLGTQPQVCSAAQRCYGDFSNNTLIWSAKENDVLDRNGRSFFRFDRRMNGSMKTRYRFQVYVEDNTPYWLKDQDGGYDLAKHKAAPSTSRRYYPFQDVVFRIREAEKFNGSQISELESSDDDEFHLRKSEWKDGSRKDDFNMAFMPIENRIVNGYPVFNFTIFHAFQKPVDYLIEVIAVDMAGNKRILRVPISMSPVGSINLRDGSSGSKRTD